MKKYEKPIARNLGDGLLYAEGACAAGSFVHPINNSTCGDGAVALNRNNGCKNGNIAHAAGGCTAGTAVGTFNPDCTNGRYAYT